MKFLKKFVQVLLITCVSIFIFLSLLPLAVRFQYELKAKSLDVEALRAQSRQLLDSPNDLQSYFFETDDPRTPQVLRNFEASGGHVSLITVQKDRVNVALGSSVLGDFGYVIYKKGIYPSDLSKSKKIIDGVYYESENGYGGFLTFLLFAALVTLIFFWNRLKNKCKAKQ